MPWNVVLLRNIIMFLREDLQTGFLQFCNDSIEKSVPFVAHRFIVSSSYCSDCGSRFVGMRRVHTCHTERAMQLIGRVLQYAHCLVACVLCNAAIITKQGLLALVAFFVGVVSWLGSLVAGTKDGLCSVVSLLQSIKQLIVVWRGRSAALRCIQITCSQSVSVKDLFFLMLRPAQIEVACAKDSNSIAKGS